MPRQTYMARKETFTPSWHHMDADGEVLGRLAVQVARVLMGKHRPEYTPHVDTGDFVVITNAAKVRMTGRKADQRFLLRFSGYPGGLKATSYRTLLEQRPELLIENAVRRMLPKGRLGRQMLKKLKIYQGAEHPHQAQQPAALVN